jgi:hypothetical protein
MTTRRNAARIDPLNITPQSLQLPHFYLPLKKIIKR